MTKNSGTCLVILLALAGPLSAGESPVNLALGKKYRLEPAPNYQHCTEAGDRSQLTDGEYVKGYFWTQAGTVGWSGTSPAIITIDLGQSEPIGGLSFNTAAGTAGVTFPAAILVLTSEDGKEWRLAGDLVALSRKAGAPPVSGYGVHRYRTMELAGQGRYVKVMIDPGGPYAFVDEIEVYRGDASAKVQPSTEPVITDVREFFARKQIDAALRRRLANDLTAVKEVLAKAPGVLADTPKVAAELKAIGDAIPSVAVESPETFTTVFPINELHRRIFKLQAEAWQRRGMSGVVVWPAQRWNMLDPFAQPASEKAGLELAMMSHEYRSAAFNLSNAGDGETQIVLRLESLPGGANPEYVTVHEVPFTDTKSGVPVAAALPLAKRVPEGFAITLPAGLTRQVWLTFRPTNVPAGEHGGRIVLKGTGINQPVIPARLKLYPFRFPDQPTLHLGGWDYTDGDGSYEVTPENRTEFIRQLREHFVDSPWARSSVMPAGKHDADGRMIDPPDPSRFRTWLDRWPGARNYYVFASVGERFAGHPMGTPAFKRAVTDWIGWWANQLRQWGIQPRQLGLLLVDEPHSAEQDRVIIEYARVIRAAQPEVVIWEDPTWRDPSQATPELFEVSQVLCPNLPMWVGGGKKFADFYLAQRQAGRRLWFYSCSGPGRLLDPYGYHRLQHWFCWKYGAEGSGFWAFGDSNGASSWNEYGAKVGAYTPLFLAARSVTPGKHMEAIREGIEDYEYLRMLRDRLEESEKKDGNLATAAAAKRLLETAADRVVGGIDSPSYIYWKEPRERMVADEVRVEILEALMRLR